MKKMSIKLNVLRTDVRNIEYNNSNLPLFPIETYKQPKDKQKISITKFQIRGVISCVINDNSNDLTQTAQVTIPKKNMKIFRNDTIDGVFVKGYLLFKSGNRLYEGNEVIIDIGYNEHYQTRFIGYVSDFQETDETIIINLEDSMYLLKRTIEMKKNFPKKLENGEVFNLKHLNKWIIQTLYDHKKNTDIVTFVPRIRCYSAELGKIVMNNTLTPAEIFKYFLTDVFNMKAFFRNEYIELKTEVLNFKYLMQPILYVGWDNWNLSEYIDFKIENDEVKIIDKLKFLEKDESDTKRTYSYTYKFMYPYDKDDSYNPIVVNNLEWYNTDKETLKITANSFNSTKNEKITTIFQYGIFHTTNEKALDAEKNRIKKDKTETGTVISDSNNLLTYNEVTLNYPNLDLNELNLRVKDYYKLYPDSGLRGSFTALGEPYVRQGDIVSLKIDTNHIDGYKSDNLIVDYYVKSVTTTFNMSTGIRQEITIDKKVIYEK